MTKKKLGRKPKVWFYHVIANELRAGKPGYVLKKTYKVERAMRAWVEKQGKPVWVVKSEADHLVVWGAFGHDNAEYYNSGAGWQRGWMPPLELHQR